MQTQIASKLALVLATVWVGAFDDDAVSQAVAAPVGLRPSSLLVLGYPAEAPEPTPRRALHDIVRREHFDERQSRHGHLVDRRVRP